RSHPCQILADIQTFEEARGPIAGRTVAWVGDGNNVCASFIHAAALFGFKLNIACPTIYHPDRVDLARAGQAGAKVEPAEGPRAHVLAREAQHPAAVAGAPRASARVIRHLIGVLSALRLHLVASVRAQGIDAIWPPRRLALPFPAAQVAVANTRPQQSLGPRGVRPQVTRARHHGCCRHWRGPPRPRREPQGPARPPSRGEGVRPLRVPRLPAAAAPSLAA